MRPLRVLTAIPLVAGLLFAGAATAAASAPGIPSVPGIGSLPYIDAGFPCSSPAENGGPGTETQLVTDESFVFLMPSQNQPPAPAQPGMGQLPDLNFMKCFFHYPDGTVPDAPYMSKDDFCVYPPRINSGAPTTTTNGQSVPYQVFAHSTFIVRDTFAILLCWGTGVD